MTSRHNISQADKIFQGEAQLPGYEAGKLGVESVQLFKWSPRGAVALALAGVVAAGGTPVLNANWGGPTGLYQMQFSSGQVVTALLTNGATTVGMYNAPPVRGQTLGPAASVLSAITATTTLLDAPPQAGSANAYSLTQAILANANALLNGALAGVPDVPRNVVGAWTTNATVTVTGTDYYGQPQTETQGPAAVFTGKKAFATVTSITTDTGITAATFGTGNVLGLPFRIWKGDVLAARMNEASENGTIVPGDVTDPATASTGDVRGTYTPTTAPDGTKILSVLFKVYSRSTNVGAFGVAPK